MATRKPKENDPSLPFVALQLLAPPVRLVSAALWKVMKQRDVMQYGVVEEFVTSACETVPGLLTVRHQGKLALGLRGRLILELCCTQPDEKVIKPHLERIRAPAAMSLSSAAARKDVKIVRTVESFRSLVHTLVTDPAEREHFFKEEFPVDYGPKFDQELEKLLWEFLIRLDQLLPVPNLTQTVSWLSDSPPVLEECARAATQPQLLKILLQHQACLGHLETAASLPPNMGDSILDSLSLPPSGRVPSDQPTGAIKSAAYPSGGSQTREETALITPVIGLISNEDVPVMISASKRTLRGDDVTDKHLNPKEASNFSLVGQRRNPKADGVKADGEQAEEEERSAAKRQRPDKSESDEEEVFRMIRPEKKRSNSLRNAASRLRRDRGDRRTNESEEDGTKTARDEVLESCMSRLGVRQLRLPQDPSLCSIFVSCLSNQPRVLLEKVSVASGGANRTERGGKSFYTKRQNQRRKSSDRPQKPDSDFLGPDDKENHPVLPSISSSPPQHRRNTETSALPGGSEDYVADSEDEATKNFKGRLFMKRYYKTKHGTYVPTLREYWKPGMTRRHLMSAGSKRR